MKNLVQLTTVLLLLIQFNGYSQTETMTKENDTIINVENKIDIENFKDCIGSYYLTEANITLTIIQEKDKMYLVAPGSKDLLTLKNDTTLYESIRGVDLEIIKGDKNTLKFTQNGYKTTIKRVTPKK